MLQRVRHLQSTMPRQRQTLLLFALGPAVILVGLAIVFLFSGHSISTDNAYLKASRLQMSADVEGRVIAVEASESLFVKKGSVLFRIDPVPFEIAVARAQANLETARGEIEAARSRYAEARAAIDRTQNELVYATREFERQKSLSARRVASAVQLDAASEKADRARLDLGVLNEQAHALLAKLGGDANRPVEQHPSYLAAKAALDRVTLDLAHTTVRAPVDGIISKIDNFRPGNYVKPGDALFAIVETERMWVEANFKETQLGKIRVGQPVQIRVDAYPGHRWTGKVIAVGAGTGAEFSILPPQNATGNWVKVTQRLPIRVSIDKAADLPPLRLGMSAKVAVDVRASKSVSSGGEETPPVGP